MIALDGGRLTAAHIAAIARGERYACALLRSHATSAGLLQVD